MPHFCVKEGFQPIKTRRVEITQPRLDPQIIMRKLVTCCLPLALAMTSLSADGFAAPQQDTGTLKYKSVKKWETLLPNETWTGISFEIPVAHAGGPGFVVDNSAFSLEVDTDGNGKPDEKIKGQGGSTVLKAKDADGKSFQYAIRIKKDRDNWVFASSGVMSGKIGGETITLIDQNNNGVWNEVGVDAMIVGKAKAASYLSRIVNLGGSLFLFEASEDGTNMSITPYEGDAGTLNGVEAYESKGKLIQAVFSSTDGKVSFDLAGAKNGMLVPAMEYRLMAGYVEKGSEKVFIRRGKMRPVTVKASQERVVEWGGPLHMEFDYFRNNKEEVTVNLPTFFGKSEEEYYNFYPGGKSPSIIVTDKESGKEVWSGKFCES